MPATPPNIDPEATPRRVLLVVYLGLAALTWFVFGQTLNHAFVRYDDQTYVYENPAITAGLTFRGVVSAFTHAHARNWHPLTTLSHMLDCQLFGLNPAGHHLMNVLLHTTAVLLLFAALRGLTGATGRSAFVAAVFAIHPLRAESVAWIAERKDVLSAVFFMLTLIAYTRYARQPSRRKYFCILLFFTLGLLAKPMLVTLPLLLLLLDYWPLKRFGKRLTILPNDSEIRVTASARIFLEKIPLVILALLDTAATLVAQRETILYSEPLPLAWRVGNALDSYLAYVGQMFWPVKLAVFYPHTADRLALWHIFLALILLAGITLLALALRRQRSYLIVGWSWYLICLLPVIGFVQVGLQGRADRYTYLPHIGLYIALTWVVSDWRMPARARRLLLPSLAAVVIALLSWQARRQTTFWSDTETLWNHALAVTQESDVAHNNVAALLLARGKLDEAIWHYQEALRLQSDTRETHYHLSVALLHTSLANALAQKGLTDEAETHYRKAVQLRDDFADAHFNLAGLLARKGQQAEAIAQYERALTIPPEDNASHVALGKLLLTSGRVADALAHFRRALEIAPDSDVVLNAYAWVLATNPDAAARNGREAVKLAEKADQLTDGKNPEVLRTLAASYAAAGRYPEAVEAAQRARSLTNDLPLRQALAEEIQSYQRGHAYGR